MLVLRGAERKSLRSSYVNMMGFRASSKERFSSSTPPHYFLSKINVLRYFLTVTFGRFLTVTFGLDPKVQVIKESLFDLDCRIKSDNDKKCACAFYRKGGVLWLT